MRSGGTISGRFGGFAAGHFILSALGMGGWLALARASAAGLTWFPIFPGYAAGLMLLYLPAGWLTAGFLRWPRADRKTAGLAVLLPALCAWCWAFGGWILAGCSGAAGRLGFSILLAAFPLACPSALFMLAALQLSAGLAGAAEELCWYAAMIPAGLLPPLLFTLGSLLSRPPKALPGPAGGTPSAPPDRPGTQGTNPSKTS